MPGLRIQGTVRTASGGAGLPGVGIYLRIATGPEMRLIATTDDQGRYRSGFIELRNQETLTVRAVLAGYTMQPPMHTWPQYGYGVHTYTRDFEASPLITPTSDVDGLYIQGTVRSASGGTGLPGVSIYVGLSSFPTRLIATTDDQGRYRSEFIELRNQETLTVKAVLAGYTMQPAEHVWSQYAYGVQTVTRDFEASPVITPSPEVAGIYIQGTVRTASGNGEGLTGVSIYLRIANGPEMRLIATTDDQGSYRSEFIELRNQETLTVKAVLAGYTMQPAEHVWSQYAYGVQTVTREFEASPVITPTSDVDGIYIQGTVRTASGGTGLPGVGIYLGIATYPMKLIATTDDQGHYLSDFIELRNQETLTLKAELPGYTMQPPKHVWSQYAYGVQTVTRDFEASPVITPTSEVAGIYIQGTVRSASGGTGLPGASIYLGLSSLPNRLIATTDGQGHYRSDFIELRNEETITVKAVLAGYTMQPPMHTWPQYGYFVTTFACDFEASALTPYQPTVTPGPQPGPLWCPSPPG